MTNNHLTFHNQIKGEVASFLTDAGIHGPEARDGITSIIVNLSRYQEEGQHLHPRIIMTESINELKLILPQCEHVCIGSGDLSTASYRNCLKKCAPLASRDWYIYIEKGTGTLNYGLIRSGESALSVTPEIKILEAVNSDLPVIVIKQIADGSVEAVASKGHILTVTMSGRELSEVDRRPKLKCLFHKISSCAEVDDKEKLELVLNRAFSHALERGHGVLAIVISHATYPNNTEQRMEVLPGLQDGTWLNIPLDIAIRIRKEMEVEDRESCASTWAAIEAVSGMLMCDGITAFNDIGQVIGYNIFARDIAQEEGVNSTNSFGGARRRTFNMIKSWLGRNITACFMASQDGAIEYNEVSGVYLP